MHLLLLFAWAALRSWAYRPGEDGTYAQNYQDLWITKLAERNGWRNGYYMDIGAFDGLKCSNTAKLDLEAGWQGLCVEPRPSSLAFATRNCTLVTRRPVGARSGDQVRFFGEVGTQLQHIGKQPHIDRTSDEGEWLESISPSDLLHCCRRPLAARTCRGLPQECHLPEAFLHFLSIDAEGWDLEVLQGFPFDNLTVGALVVETSTRHEPVTRFLAARGYRRVPVQNAGVDSYYVHASTHYSNDLNAKPWRQHPPLSGGC